MYPLYCPYTNGQFMPLCQYAQFAGVPLFYGGLTGAHGLPLGTFNRAEGEVEEGMLENMMDGMMDHKKMSPDEILDMIERHHSTMLKTLTDCKMSLDEAREYIRNIIMITVHHTK